LDPAALTPAGIDAEYAWTRRGGVILLENQWDYTGVEDYRPIERWTDDYPAPQTFNAVYAAIQTAVGGRTARRGGVHGRVARDV
jgi:hypothetical protein